MVEKRMRDWINLLQHFSMLGELDYCLPKNQPFLFLILIQLTTGSALHYFRFHLRCERFFSEKKRSENIAEEYVRYRHEQPFPAFLFCQEIGRHEKVIRAKKQIRSKQR
jgi:hypothetical protein